MCDECDKLDAELKGDTLAEFAGESSPQLRGAILAAAMRIVLEETRISRLRAAKLLGVSKTTAYRIAAGAPVDREIKLKWLMAGLTEILSKHAAVREIYGREGVCHVR